MTLRTTNFATRPLLAVAAFLAILILSPAPQALAQKAPATMEKATPAEVSKPAEVAKPARIEKRIADLHDKLGITPPQEDSWKNLAQVMRDNAAKMKALLEKWSQEAGTMTALESLKLHGEMAAAHAEGMNKLIPAFESLYSTMTVEQKKVADEVFAQHEGRRHKRQGK